MKYNFKEIWIKNNQWKGKHHCEKIPDAELSSEEKEKIAGITQQVIFTEPSEMITNPPLVTLAPTTKPSPQLWDKKLKQLLIKIVIRMNIL